jgi:four helix bundle protein
MRLVQALPDSRLADVIDRQVLRSATSVGANYRAARRARSTADFIAKLKIVEEEADETVYWLELHSESGLMTENKLEALLAEGNALVAIIIASIRTTRGLREDAESYN